MTDQPPTGPIRKNKWPPNWVTPRPGGDSGGMPRWVKVFGSIGAILVLLVIVMLFTGHGPGRHMHGGRGVPGASSGAGTA